MPEGVCHWNLWWIGGLTLHGQADIPHGIFTLMTQAIESTYLTLKKWSEIGVSHLD